MTSPPDDFDYWKLSVADRIVLAQDILDSVLAEAESGAVPLGDRWMRRYSAATQKRAASLPQPARRIFEAVLRLLQHAQEGGIADDEEYVAFMGAILREATERMTVRLDHVAESLRK